MARVEHILWRFFALSVALHALAVLLLYPIRPAPTPRPETIPFRFCLTRKESSPRQSARFPDSAPTRPSRAPTVVAKKDSPIPYEKPTMRAIRSRQP